MFQPFGLAGRLFIFLADYKIRVACRCDFPAKVGLLIFPWLCLQHAVKVRGFLLSDCIGRRSGARCGKELMRFMQTFSLIGAGRVARVLGQALVGCGYQAAAVNSRRIESAQQLAEALGARVASAAAAAQAADFVLITTPDDCIAEVAAAVAAAGGWRAGQVVLHTAGALATTVLQPAAAGGAAIGSLHPLQSFAGGAASLQGVYFACSGAAPALQLCRSLVAEWGGIYWELAEANRVQYHAAACAASNYLVVLLDWAVRQLAPLGLTEAEAQAALAPLVQGTLQNLQRQGRAALTGPISRGDAATLAAHLAVLPPDEQVLYRQLGAATLQTAAALGRLTEEQQQELRRVLRYEEAQTR